MQVCERISIQYLEDISNKTKKHCSGECCHKAILKGDTCYPLVIKGFRKMDITLYFCSLKCRDKFMLYFLTLF